VTTHSNSAARQMKRSGIQRTYKKGLLARHKQNLIRRDGLLCFYCGEQESKRARDFRFTVEHLIPVAHGGHNAIENLALAHAICNEEAGSLSVMEKIKLRESKVCRGCLE
jgi:5-methylcytosine-specific restriction endonuclease McrA